MIKIREDNEEGSKFTSNIFPTLSNEHTTFKFYYHTIKGKSTGKSGVAGENLPAQFIL